MTNEPKWYGVSSGNGNDGVSHVHPNYLVKTNEPWRLAELAAISEFKVGKGQTWARENVQIDGEADYTISAVFYESYEDQEEIAEMTARLEAMHEDDEAREELQNAVDSWGRDSAYFIVEVFPWDCEYKSPEDMSPTYLSLEDCFGLDMVASVKPDTVGA